MIERAVILTTHNHITEQYLLHMAPARDMDSATEDRGAYPSFQKAKEEFEKGYLSQLLLQVRGNVAQAAKLAHRYRGDLYRLMKKYGLKAEDFK